MTNKLCFNCFEKVSSGDQKCIHCGVSFEVELKDRVEDKPRKHFDEELKKLKDIETGKQQKDRYLQFDRPRDLIWIVVLTSLLGILQIYTSGIVDTINVISTIFEIEVIIPGYYLTISGFLYFSGIVFFYKNYYFMRKLYLLGNLINLYILLRIYESLKVININLNSPSVLNLPIVVDNFLDKISMFSVFMLIFGLTYVIQTSYMYRREILNLKLGR